MAAITNTITETRPSLSVDFMPVDMDFVNYTQKYNNIRTRPITGWTMAPDLLSRTYVQIFTSEDAANTFINDPVVAAYILAVNTYNTTHGIIRTSILS